MRLVPVLLLLAALVLSGCSDGAGDDPDPDPDVPDGDAGGDGSDADADDDADPDGGDGDVGDDNGTEPRDPVTWDVSIEGNDFVDGSLTIQVGDTVVWTHRDSSVPHTVTADDGAFDSGSSPAQYMTEVSNPEFSFTFDETGEFPYHCEVHASMTDTITVLERSDATP